MLQGSITELSIHTNNLFLNSSHWQKTLRHHLISYNYMLLLLPEMSERAHTVWKRKTESRKDNSVK